MTRAPDPAWLINARNREEAVAHMLSLGSCIRNHFHACPKDVVLKTGCTCSCHAEEEEDGWSLI